MCTREGDYHERYREADKLEPDGTEIDWPVPYWWVDAGAALMLVWLAAVEEGLAAAFFGVPQPPLLAALLGIPEDVAPVGVITVGHAASRKTTGSAARGWKPLEEIVRWERW